MVVGFFVVRCVHSGAPWGSSSSFGFVEFILERSGGGRMNSGTPWVSLGTFWRSWGRRTIRARPVGHQVHLYTPLVSSGSFRRAMGVVEFIVARALGVVGLIRVRWVHSGAPWVSLGCACLGLSGSFGFVEPIWGRP